MDTWSNDQVKYQSTSEVTMNFTRPATLEPSFQADCSFTMSSSEYLVPIWTPKLISVHGHNSIDYFPTMHYDKTEKVQIDQPQKLEETVVIKDSCTTALDL